MAITRRQFLKRTGALTAGSFLGPSFFANPLLQRAVAQTIGNRFFVVLFLDGGNDGLNTITPIADGNSGSLRQAYEAARNTSTSGLQLLPAQLAATAIGNDPLSATPLALHPSLSGIKSLYDQGHAAIIQGCGYPTPNLSHFESRRKWETGDPLNTGAGAGNGWLGRYLSTNYGSTDLPAASVHTYVAAEMRQYVTNVLAATSWSQLQFPYDTYAPSDATAKQTAYSGLHAEAALSANAAYKYAGDVGGATLSVTQTYPQLHTDYVGARPTWDALYDHTAGSPGAALLEAAKCIFGVVNNKVDTRFFEISQGGYDTHSAQGAAAGSHANLLKSLGDAVQVFYNDCENMGVADKLCLVVWSEFGRRVQQNNDGTDHGTQGPVFVIGGNVNGGVYGNHPNINAANLDTSGNTVYSQAPGNPHRSTDLRDVYGTLLKHWLGMADPSPILPLDGGDPNLFWTAPNFDLGFV